LQSHRRDGDGKVLLDILPALPEHWKWGKVCGLGAHGGLTVDIEWSPERVKIQVGSAVDTVFTLNYRMYCEKVVLSANSEIYFNLNR
jgi:alpha-L-fucosidase 2